MVAQMVACYVSSDTKLNATFEVEVQLQLRFGDEICF